MTLLDIAQGMKGRLRDGYSAKSAGVTAEGGAVEYGTAVGDSSGGYVTVLMDGAPTDDPNYPSAFYYEVETDAPVANGARIGYVRQDGYGKAVALETLSGIASNADAIATATNQHFWTDTNGVHVSDTATDPDGSRNIVMNSQGVLLRDGADYMAAFEPTAVAFYDGNGNDVENIVASFGSDGATIGGASSAGMVLSDEGLTMHDDGGIAIMEMMNSGTSVSEKITKTANTRPYASFDLTGIATGSTFKCGFSNTATMLTFTQGTAATNAVTVGAKTLTFDYDGSTGLEATLTGGNNASASVVYQSNAVDAPYFTLGTRYGTPYPFSATIGRGLEASTGMGTVVGQFNADDGGVFQVGIGTDDSNRKNAMSISQSGAVAFGTDVAETTVANVITAGTYITVSAVSYTTWGKVAQLLVTFTRSSAISDGQNFTVGTVASGKRPVQTAGGSSNSFVGWITDTGTLTVRNVTGAQIAANTTVYISFTYLLP